MANGILTLTKSGFGKSTSLGHIPKEELGIETDIVGLDPKETLLINVKGKPLPFRGWRKSYQLITQDAPPVTANYLPTTDYAFISKTLDYFNVNRPEVKNVVIDDAQYLMAEEFMSNALKSGYEKFSKMAKNMYDVINKGLKMRDDITFIVLAHEYEEKDGSFKMKTIGKMLDEKVTLEGLFTIVLYGRETYDATQKKSTKQFVTNFDGTYPAKSPVGMFKELYIPNDMGYVVKNVNLYNNGE